MYFKTQVWRKLFLLEKVHNSNLSFTTRSSQFRFLSGRGFNFLLFLRCIGFLGLFRLIISFTCRLIFLLGDKVSLVIHVGFIHKLLDSSSSWFTVSSKFRLDFFLDWGGRNLFIIGLNKFRYGRGFFIKLIVWIIILIILIIIIVFLTITHHLDPLPFLRIICL